MVLVPPAEGVGLKAPLGGLPERVRAAITEEQRRSEVLVGWIQLAIVGLFAALYFASRRTFGDMAPFAPVPIALAAYALFTAFRLGLAYRGRLPAWFLGLSVVIDMGALLVLIWSFHLQYQQPPALYLKAPTILYVFILIALRALRFEVRYVVLAGAVAALGWLVLLAYAIAAGPDGGPVTRDYVHYMTSLSVLIGGEIDKIISIVVVTAVLAMAMVRGRRMLVRAVAEGTAASDLKRFFAPEVAAQITAAEIALKPGHADRREAAILFVDLRGFTPLTRRMSAAEALNLLGEYQACLVPVIRRHGGSIDKFLGDGILASFGAVAATETYAADAMRAADALMAAAEGWAVARAARGLESPGVGAALACGTVMFGVIGDADRLEYTVIGDAVNLAAKLEKHTKAEAVRALASAGLYELACTQGYQPPPTLRLLTGRRVAGVEEPIDLAVIA